MAQVPLCLLTPDMQNRRIIDRLLKSAGGEARPTLESDSMILLFSHVRTGRWASVMPARLAETLGLTDTIRAIPITASGGGADHRPGGAGARADDADHRRAGGGSQARGAEAGLIAVTFSREQTALPFVNAALRATNVMITQLNPPLPMQTPKGDGLAHFVIDYGPESDLLWVIFMQRMAPAGPSPTRKCA